MRIPDRIKIGGHAVEVKGRKELKDNKLNYLGLAVLSLRRILLARKLQGERIPKSQRAQTFLHEVVHMTAHTYGVALKEREVAALSEGLFQVFRDNDLDFGDKKKRGKK